MRELRLGLGSVSEPEEDVEADGDIFLRLRPGTPGFTELGILIGEVLLTPGTAGGLEDVGKLGLGRLERGKRGMPGRERGRAGAGWLAVGTGLEIGVGLLVTGGFGGVACWIGDGGEEIGEVGDLEPVEAAGGVGIRMGPFAVGISTVPLR